MQALLIDDALVQRRFVTLVLTEFRNLHIDEAATGSEALEMLRRRPYDVVLLDLNLPHIGGLQILEAVKEQENGPNRDTAFVVVSGQADDATVARCKALGVAKFLSKPVPATHIRDAVRLALKLPEEPDPRRLVEKRRVPRLNIPVTVRFQKELPFTAVTGDVSPFGAFILSTVTKPVGTNATIEIILPHIDQPLEVRCKVVHIRPYAVGTLPQGFGVRFATDQPENLARLVRAFTTPVS